LNANTVQLGKIVPLMMPVDRSRIFFRECHGPKQLNIMLGRFIKSLNGRVFGQHKLMSKVGAGNKSEVWCPKVRPASPNYPNFLTVDVAYRWNIDVFTVREVREVRMTASCHGPHMPSDKEEGEDCGWRPV